MLTQCATLVLIAVTMGLWGERAARGEGAQTAPSAGRAAGGPGDCWVYIGTLSGAKSKGIYLFRLEAATGQLIPRGLVTEVASPNFLTLHPNGRVLYAVASAGAAGVPAPGKAGDGVVVAYTISAETGELTRLSRQASGGRQPVFVAVDPAGKALLVANYDGASVAALPVAADGALAAVSARVVHEGSSVNPSRQKKPYPHSIITDPAGRFAFAPDLGTDKILSYRLDAAQGTLTANDPPSAPVTAGDGPRHMAFDPAAHFAYAITELTSKVVAFDYDAERGVLKAMQSISALPADFTGSSSGAEICVHPSGRFVYVSNRGHDSIGIFAIDAATGKLTLVGHQPTGGKTPRGFSLDPTGTFLVAGNQGSNTITLFRVDAKTGLLTPEGAAAEVPNPVSVVFVPIPVAAAVPAAAP